MKFVLYVIVLVVILLIVAFLMGPKVQFAKVNPKLPTLEYGIHQISGVLHELDKKIPDLKEGNHSEIIWAEAENQKTEYVLLYLHGFSASHEEGAPVHENFARRYGMNLLLPRLKGHGRQSAESFVDLTPKNYLESAKRSIQMAKLLGEKVIIMACSTGATLATYLVANNPNDVEAMVFFSPNFALYDSNAKLMNGPWGDELSRWLFWGDYNEVQYDSLGKKYWNEKYRIEGIQALVDLLEQTMTPQTYEKINVPVFVGCYYKDEDNQDKVVSIKEMEHFLNTIATELDEKQMVRYAHAPGHVFTSGVFSDMYTDVEKDVYHFAEKVLEISPQKQELVAQ